VTTLANAAGLTIGPFLAGALLQYAPLPRQLSYLILLVLLVAAFALVLRMPDGERANGNGWRPTPVGVPAGQRHTFLTAAAGVAVVYAVGALFLSLGAQIVAQILHTGNALVIGAMLSSLSVVIGISSVTLRQIPPRAAIAAGGLCAAAGLGLLYVVAQAGNLALFLVAAVFLGASFGLSLMGGVRLIATRAPEHHRARVIAALYLSAYAAQGVAAVAAGLVATHYGLHRAVDVFVPVAAAFALAATASAALHRR
jgi:MFS family permease